MSIPAFLCIDVEQDDLTLQVGERRWEGFEAIVQLMDRLREQLRDRSGIALHATWFLRMDPLVEHCFGRPDFVVHRHGDLIERVRAQGDWLGIHPHAHRWDDERGIYSDYANAKWASHCVVVAADAFERCFGEPPRRCRHGGYFMPEEVVDASIARGIEVDLTVEPGLGPKSDDASFGDYATGSSTDFRGYPRSPYRLSQTLVEIPLSTYDYRTALASGPRRLAGRFLRRRREALPLNPWKEWRDPKTYWDLVERSMDEVPIPYVAIAVRSDPPGSLFADHARRLFEHLPDHAIVDRLDFADPLAFARTWM